MSRCRRTLGSILLLFGFASPGVANESPVSDPSHHEPVSREEVRANERSQAFFRSDVVLLIDHSTLALRASGVDVDADGIVGRDRIPGRDFDRMPRAGQFWTTDAGDTIEALQLRVAEALVERLAARQNRVGLASFTLRARTGGFNPVKLSDRPAVVVDVGEPTAVLSALAEFPSVKERRRTDLRRLLERGVELLDAASDGKETTRSQAIILLSHGRPSAPDGLGWSSQKALDYADKLAEKGIELWAVPLGTADRAYLSELTGVTGGELLPLERLDATFGVPASGDSKPTSLESQSNTSQAPGRSSSSRTVIRLVEK